MENHSGSDVAVWQTWADTLHRAGVASLLADFLDALGPINFFGAQMVYLAQPILSPFVADDQLDALTALLEDSRRTREFIAILRQPREQP